MKARLLAVVLFGCVLQPWSARAASDSDVTTLGSWRLNARSAFAFHRLSVSGADINDVGFAVGVDNFVIDHVSFGGTLGLSWTEIGPVDITIFSLVPKVGVATTVRNALVPFLRAGPGFSVFDVSGADAETQFVFGVDGGADFLITSMIAAGLSVSYMHHFGDPDLDEITIPLHFSLYW